MKKPTPPQPKGPAFGATPSSAQMDMRHPPLDSKMSIEDLSPIVDPLDPPRSSVSSSSAAPLCDSCQRCWKLVEDGSTKNIKSDGSRFVRVERFCRFGQGDHLFSLAERTVLECNLFLPKKTEV